MGRLFLAVTSKEAVSWYVFPTVRATLLKTTPRPPPAEIPRRGIVRPELMFTPVWPTKAYRYCFAPLELAH
jgi:hypothetical protein